MSVRRALTVVTYAACTSGSSSSMGAVVDNTVNAGSPNSATLARHRKQLTRNMLAGSCAISIAVRMCHTSDLFAVGVCSPLLALKHFHDLHLVGTQVGTFNPLDTLRIRWQVASQKTLLDSEYPLRWLWALVHVTLAMSRCVGRTCSAKPDQLSKAHCSEGRPCQRTVVSRDRCKHGVVLCVRRFAPGFVSLVS